MDFFEKLCLMCFPNSDDGVALAWHLMFVARLCQTKRYIAVSEFFFKHIVFLISQLLTQGTPCTFFDIDATKCRLRDQLTLHVILIVLRGQIPYFGEVGWM